ncbi:unnamed protein product [[Candida] boidinii]|nr:unnamed protein product [[Candida] boidinii]
MLSREFVVRRISEGETGRLKEELKCEACGKGYKHITSLAKHLWEHTPEWNMTKKLSISKHQQVQLLEAASILCGMTDGSIPIGSIHNNQNQQSTTYLVPPNQPQESIHESTTKFRYNGSNQQQQQQQQNDNKQRPISPSSADEDNAIEDSNSPSSINSVNTTTNTSSTNITTSNNSTSLKTDYHNIHLLL